MGEDAFMKIFFYLIFVSSLAQAITFTEIRKLAIERSPLLSAEELELHALRSEAQQKGKWQNPQLLGQFGSLKSGSMTGATVEVSVTQPVPLSDKFSLRKEIAEVAASQKRVHSEFYKEWVAHQAVLSAWKVRVTSELFKHGQERTKRLGLVKSYLETRPRVSIRQRVELNLISSLLLQLSRDQDAKAHELKLAESDLEFWLGKKIPPAELNFSLPDTERIVSPAEASIENDPELKQAALEAKVSRIDRELARKEQRPDLYLGAGYRVENVTPVNHFSYGIVGLNIPIWDSGSSRSESAGARARRSEKVLEETRRQTSLKHRKQVEEAKFYLSQVKRFPHSLVVRNERSISEAEKGFKQGVLDVNTFLQAETQSHEVIDQVWVSWMNYVESLSQLALMQGKELNWEKM